VNTQGFTTVIGARAGRHFDGARVGWIAYDADEDGKWVRSGNTITRRNEAGNYDFPFYGPAPYSKAPAIFIGIQEIDFGNDRPLRVHSEISVVTRERLTWQVKTWADSNMDHMACDWIAIES